MNKKVLMPFSTSLFTFRLFPVNIFMARCRKAIQKNIIKAGCSGVRGQYTSPPPSRRVRSDFLHNKNEKYRVKSITYYLHG